VTIRFSCEQCGKAFSVKDSLAGKRVACPGCGGALVVPRKKKTAEAPPPRDEAGEAEPVKLPDQRLDEGTLDMNPMVDVALLLLIFFMVTAAFSRQKSIEVRAREKDETAEQAQTSDELKEYDFVIIQFGKDDTVWVNDREAPSAQALLIKLREAISEGSAAAGAGSLLVLADRECRHETVVMALDAGNAVGVEDIRLTYVDEDDL